MTGASGGPTSALLALQGITKHFGNVLALDDVSLRVRAGSVHALLGENGAGKTTLMRIAFGLITPDTGTVLIGGASHNVRSAIEAISAGAGMVHQHFTLVPAMTVAENVALGGRRRFDAASARRRVDEIGQRSGLALDPDARAGELSVGGQQRLEIAKALARDARLLILDEPTAVLAPSEAADLLQWLRAFADEGNAVVLITHKLTEALAIADDVTVLRHGRVVLDMPAAATNVDALAAAMLGEIAPVERTTERTQRGEPIAVAIDADILDERGVLKVRGATLDARSGEVLGIAAVEGAGQRELLRALAGRARTARGTLRLPAMIGFVPEDRHRDALVLDFSAAENVALEGAGQARGRIPWRTIGERTERLIAAFDVRGATSGRSVRTLSGGNQQKLILARELDGRPALLIAENPTRGLDIRAAQDVRTRLRNAAAQGTAVVLYSSDLDEVLSLATRVLVVHAGSVREVPGDRDAIGRAMLGVA